MKYEELFTEEAREHFQRMNGGITGTLCHVCPICDVIRAWRDVMFCPTCKRPYEGS